MKRKIVSVLCWFWLAIASHCDQIPDEPKVLVDHSGNLIGNTHAVKPTAKPVAHEPGVPPHIGFGSGPPILAQPLPTTTRKPINNNPFNWFTSLFNNKGNQGHKIPSFVTDANFTDSTEIYVDDGLTGNGTHGFNLTSTNVVESELKPNSYNLTAATENLIAEHINNPPNKGVVDWVLGLVGIDTSSFNINNNNNNNNNKPSSIDQRFCGKCSCGVTFKQTRIVGGVETQVNAYPWMTILTYNGRFYCGASVINNKYLITATHCVNGFTRERLQALFLDHDRTNQFETKTFTRGIAAILRHRSYNMGGSYNNDIALLRLDKDLDFTGLLRPVCLPTVGKSYTGYTGIVTGWGATEEHGQVSSRLMEVNVPILSNIDCRKTGYGSKITDNMLCAGYKQGQKDSCQGDSGGPLHVVNSTYHTIVGIVSWGEGCAEPNYPGVYTRVNRYISWIKSNTKDACYCS